MQIVSSMTLGPCVHVALWAAGGPGGASASRSPAALHGAGAKSPRHQTPDGSQVLGRTKRSRTEGAEGASSTAGECITAIFMWPFVHLIISSGRRLKKRTSG